MQHLHHRFGIAVAIACLLCALVVVFSGVLARRAVPLSAWRLPGDPQHASGSAAARCACLLVMGLAYGVIAPDNALFFLSLTIGCTLCLPFLLSRYRQVLAAHVLLLPFDGGWFPVGEEAVLHAEAKAELAAARRREPGLALHDFLYRSGPRLQRPSAFWPVTALASQVRMLDTLVVLMAVLAATALFLALLLAQTLPVFF